MEFNRAHCTDWAGLVKGLSEPALQYSGAFKPYAKCFVPFAGPDAYLVASQTPRELK